MSKIKQKSEFNIIAAERLLNESLFAPSVHCSYYSCYQLLKYTINYFFEVDYSTQSQKIASSKQNSHQYVFNYVVNELKGLASYEDCKSFKRLFKQLKLYRTQSDYENIEVDSVKGHQAFDVAKEIRAYITKNFHV